MRRVRRATRQSLGGTRRMHLPALPRSAGSDRNRDHRRDVSPAPHSETRFIGYEFRDCFGPDSGGRESSGDPRHTFARSFAGSRTEPVRATSDRLGAREEPDAQLECVRLAMAHHHLASDVVLLVSGHDSRAQADPAASLDTATFPSTRRHGTSPCRLEPGRPVPDSARSPVSCDPAGPRTPP